MKLHPEDPFVDSILENIPDMIFVKEAKELRFVRFNKAGEELLGYKREELLGKNDYDFFPKSEADFFTSKDRAVLNSGRLLEIHEEPIHTRHKGIRVLHTKKIPIYDRDGTPQYLLGISEDITQKKEAEEISLTLLKEQAARIEAEKAVQVRNDFISIASHELKTPLTALKLQIQLTPKLVEKIEFAEKAKLLDLVQRSQRQLTQLSNLVERLLDLSRISYGTLTLHREDVNLNEVVLNAVERYRIDLELAACEVKLVISDQPLTGKWDKMRIDQVVSNLISNAMKFGIGGPIEITVEPAGRHAQLRVRDYGIGIEPQDQSRIFGRFERAASVKQFGGLGLGLYIVDRIVKAHHGSITLQSAPGEGAEFKVVLPLES